MAIPSMKNTAETAHRALRTASGCTSMCSRVYGLLAVFDQLFRVTFTEGEGLAVDAEPQAGFIARSIVEYVTEMSVAPCAVHLFANHADACVALQPHILLVHRLKKGGPTCTGVKLGRARKERELAAGAAIEADLVVVVEDAAKCRFGSVGSEYPVLLVG